VKLRALWEEFDREGMLDLSGTEISGGSRTQDLSLDRAPTRTAATIRRVWEDYGVMVDPHTADGVKVGLEHREQNVPLVCMETASRRNSRRRYAKRLAGAAASGRIRKTWRNCRSVSKSWMPTWEADTTSRGDITFV